MSHRKTQERLARSLSIVQRHALTQPQLAARLGVWTKHVQYLIGIAGDQIVTVETDDGKAYRARKAVA